MDTYNVKHVVTPRKSLRSYLNLEGWTYRIKTSPSAPFDFPSWYSSVFASYQCSLLVLLKDRCDKRYLKVHVAIGADQETFVLKSPF